MNSNPRGAVLVCNKPALASKTPMYGSRATVACANAAVALLPGGVGAKTTSVQPKVKTGKP